MKIDIEIVKWQNEDEITSLSMYDALYPLSKVNIVRLFPKEIIVNSKAARQVDREKIEKVLKEYGVEKEFCIEVLTEAIMSELDNK